MRIPRPAKWRPSSTAPAQSAQPPPRRALRFADRYQLCPNRKQTRLRRSPDCRDQAPQERSPSRSRCLSIGGSSHNGKWSTRAHGSRIVFVTGERSRILWPSRHRPCCHDAGPDRPSVPGSAEFAGSRAVCGRGRLAYSVGRRTSKTGTGSANPLRSSAPMESKSKSFPTQRSRTAVETAMPPGEATPHRRADS